MNIFTFEVEFEDCIDDANPQTFGVVKLCGAEIYREEVSTHRIYYSSYPGEKEELVEDVLYHFGLKLGKLLKDQDA